MTKLTGTDAIDYARTHGLEVVHKYADPTEGARDVTLDEARDICREDPSLIWVEDETLGDMLDERSPR